MVFVMKLITKIECLPFSLLSGFEEILDQYTWCRKSSCTFNPLMADSCGIPWAFSDIVIPSQMSCDVFLSWLKGYWPSTNMKNMPWHTQAVLGHSEPFSCPSTVATLTIRLNAIKTCASCGMVGTWKKGCIPHCAHAAASSLLPPSPMTINVFICLFSSPFLQWIFPFPLVSICLFHLLLFDSLDSWLPAHAY